MALASSKLNIIVVLGLCVYYAHAVCTCEKTPPSGKCVCESDNSNPARCKACVCDHITTYVNGPLVCSCRPGYAVSSRDPKKCVDINECANTEEPVCEHNCTNTPGGFSCACRDGYDVNTTDSTKCVEKKYNSCDEVTTINPRPVVTLTSGLQVMCDTVTDGGGWTIFQRRVSGTVDFYRNWTEYKNGFGDFTSGNFYLGNENIYLLTSNRQTELRVDMAFNGTSYFVKYSSFSISSEADGYRLYVDGYTGDAADSLDYHNGMMFSTFDRDNDECFDKCAVEYQGAWWFSCCCLSNLNGAWGGVVYRACIFWRSVGCVSFTEMKFR